MYLALCNGYSKQSSACFMLEWESLSLPPVATHVEIRYPKDKKGAFVGKCGLSDLPHDDRGNWSKKQELTPVLLDSFIWLQTGDSFFSNPTIPSFLHQTSECSRRPWSSAGVTLARLLHFLSNPVPWPRHLSAFLLLRESSFIWKFSAVLKAHPQWHKKWRKAEM